MKRLQFFNARTTLFGSTKVLYVAAMNADDAIELTRRSLPWYSRWLTKISTTVNTDPVELSESGYLQKMARMYVIDPLYYQYT